MKIQLQGKHQIQVSALIYLSDISERNNANLKIPFQKIDQEKCYQLTVGNPDTNIQGRHNKIINSPHKYGYKNSLQSIIK